MKVYKVVEVIDGQEVENAITKTGEKTYTGIVDLTDIKSDKTNTVRIFLEWQEDATGINDERDSGLGLEQGTSFSIPVTVKVNQYIGEDIVEFTTP